MGAHSTVDILRSTALNIYKNLVLVNYGEWKGPEPTDEVLERFFDRVLDRALHNTVIVSAEHRSIVYPTDLLEDYTREYLAEHPEEIKGPGADNSEQAQFITMLKRAGIQYHIAVQSAPALTSTRGVALVVQVGRNPFSCTAFCFDSDGKLLSLN